MITILTRRVLPFVALAVLMGGLMRGQQVPPATADLWFHLRFGKEFLGGWDLRSPGHLGIFDTAEWTPTQWLTQVAMAWSAEHWGLNSVVWAAGVVVLSITALQFASCRRLAAPLPAAIAVVLGTIAASPGLSARPQILSYLFVVLTTAAWLGTWRDGRPRYWLVLIAWIWPMCHGMWPVGISISVAAFMGLLAERRSSRADLTRLATIPVASALFAALTPVGLQTYRSLIAIGDRSQYFNEWGPPDFTAPAAAVLVVMIVLVTVSGLRSDPVPWTHVALLVLALGWSLYSMRTTVVGALIITPLLAGALARLVPAIGLPTRRERVSLLAMTVLASLILWPVVQYRSGIEVVPMWVSVRLDTMADNARVLNDWDTGSWFLYRHPDLQLVMHGYGDVFTDAEIERNADLLRLKPGWVDELTELDVDAALLDPESPLGYALERVLDWDVLQEDADFVLLVPPST